MSSSWRHLLQDDEVAGVPRLGDDVESATSLPQHRVVDVLEILEAQIVLREEGGYQSVVLEDVDRRALVPVGTIERGDHRIATQVVDVAGQGPGGHLEGGEVLAVPREAVDLGVCPVGHLDPPGARGHRDAVARAELTRRVPLAAEGEVVPRGPKRAVAGYPRGQDEVEARVAGGHVEEAVEELDVGGNERS